MSVTPAASQTRVLRRYRDHETNPFKQVGQAHRRQNLPSTVRRWPSVVTISIIGAGRGPERTHGSRTGTDWGKVGKAASGSAEISTDRKSRFPRVSSFVRLETRVFEPLED